MLLLSASAANAQWRILESHTTADLSGVFAVDNSVAWVSSSAGTVLRTEDGGRTWRACATPPSGASLNFSNIQALDNKTAVVMATGKGELSHLYRTTDGCQTWKRVLYQRTLTLTLCGFPRRSISESMWR